MNITQENLEGVYVYLWRHADGLDWVYWQGVGAALDVLINLCIRSHDKTFMDDLKLLKGIAHERARRAGVEK